MPLANGNYVLVAHLWSNGPIAEVGAITWGDGTQGVSGVISAANSLIGSTAEDRLGSCYWLQSYPGCIGFQALDSGDYIVISPDWDNGAVENAGAVSLLDGNAPTSGEISAANSVVGEAEYDLGNARVTPLVNGNFVLSAPHYNGAESQVGAVILGVQGEPFTGSISDMPALVGSSEFDMVGEWVTPLTNGNYVVASPTWDGDDAGQRVEDAGAVTWMDGSIQISATVSSANSLVGKYDFDRLGRSSIDVGYSVPGRRWNPIAPLANGNYVIPAHTARNNLVYGVGAAIWADGTKAITGTLEITSVLHGPHADARTGTWIFPLLNGHYIVASHGWNDGSNPNDGALTWGDGTVGTIGPVGSDNSLIGYAKTSEEYMHKAAFSSVQVHQRKDGSVLVRVPWGIYEHPVATPQDAIIQLSGDRPFTGTVSPANSLVPNTILSLNMDHLYETESGGIFLWNLDQLGSEPDELGAITWFPPGDAPVGMVGPSNSIFAQKATVGAPFIAWNPVRDYLILGKFRKLSVQTLAAPEDASAEMIDQAGERFGITIVTDAWLQHQVFLPLSSGR